MTLPQRTMSWALSGHSPGPRRVPLTKVPLVLPRSRTRQPCGVGLISAWRRLTELSSRTISRVASRPARRIDVPFPGLSFDFAVDAPQANVPLHALSPEWASFRLGASAAVFSGRTRTTTIAHVLTSAERRLPTLKHDGN